MPSTARFDARPLGAQATATRDAILMTLEVELELTGWRQIRVIEIARTAGMSPATFYQYFPSLDAAYDELREQMRREGRQRTKHMKIIDALLRFERTMLLTMARAESSDV